jgi:hypothetical protein
MKKLQLKRLLRGKVLGVIVLTLAMGLMAAPSAKAASIDLLTAGPFDYAVLGLGTVVTTTSSTITGIFPAFGNVGVLDDPGAPPHALLTATSGSITGTVFVQDLAQFNNITNIVPDGGVVVTGTAAGNKLSVAAADAIARSAFYAGLAATDATTTINTDTTIIGNGGLNVLNLSGGLSLSGSEVLTLQGTAADAFVINVPNDEAFSMIGTSKILVSGGLLPQNVLINLLETNASYSVLGDEIDGIILAPNVLFTASGLIVGEVIGHDVTLHSSAIVRNPVVPVPPTAILFGSGLLGLGLLGGRRKWFRKS